METVYIRINEKNEVVAVNSSAFLQDTAGWIAIDRGTGDRYHHAQGNYFPHPLGDRMGGQRYVYEDGAVREKTEEEKAQAALAYEKKVRIEELKRLLAQTDYAVIKIAEGAAQEQEYAQTIAQRQAWRAEIQQLEG